MNRVTDTHAAWLARRVCAQFVEEREQDETPVQELMRAIRSCATLTAAIGARVNPIYMNEVIRLFEELHKVHASTHDDIDQNAALTVNNVPDLIDSLNRYINEAIAELLAHTEPLQVRQDVMA